MKYIIFFICLLWFGINTNAQSTKIEPDIFLNKTMLKNASIDVIFVKSIDYTLGHFLLLSSHDQFYILGVGGIIPLFGKTKNKIDAFSVATSDNILMMVSGKSLFQVDSLGNLIKIFELPNEKMSIASGSEQIYLFESRIQKDKSNYSILSLNKNLDLVKFVTMKSPIIAVYEYNSNLFFTTKNQLFCANKQTRSFVEIFTLPQKKDTIISIVGDFEHNSFYFSTNQTIYRIKDGKLEIISTDFGGILRYDGEGLLIFNPEKSLIIRLRNNCLYTQNDK